MNRNLRLDLVVILFTSSIFLLSLIWIRSGKYLSPFI